MADASCLGRQPVALLLLPAGAAGAGGIARDLVADGQLVNYDAIHPHTLFRERLGTKVGDFPHAERIGRETISLPLHARLEPEEVDGVVDALRSVLEEAR